MSRVESIQFISGNDGVVPYTDEVQSTAPFANSITIPRVAYVGQVYTITNLNTNGHDLSVSAAGTLFNTIGGDVSSFELRINESIDVYYTGSSWKVK